MITALQILLIIYLSILALVGLFFLIFMLLYGFRKSWAVTRWLLVYVVITPFDLLSPMAILGYWSDRWKITRWITWIWMDDSRMGKSHNRYSNDYWVFIQDRGQVDETWWISILWHIGRNRKYNAVNLFKVPDSTMYNSDGKKIGNNFIHSIEYISDNLHKNDKNKTHIDQNGNWVTMAGLKYIPKRKGDDIFQVNQGDEISIKTSIIGKGGMFYGIGDWFSFRYSSCKEVKLLFFWKRWLTIKIGTNSSRYITTIKNQKLKKWR